MIDLDKYAGHTPGPWIVSDRWPEIHATDARATIVAEVTGARSNPSAVSDARLIADAPELLAEVVRLRARLAALGYDPDMQVASEGPT